MGANKIPKIIAWSMIMGGMLFYVKRQLTESIMISTAANDEREQVIEQVLAEGEARIITYNNESEPSLGLESPLEESEPLVESETPKPVRQPPEADPRWEKFRKIYMKMNPMATDPNDKDTMLHIASATDVQPNKNQWMTEGTSAFNSCPNLQSWMQCSYSASRNTSYMDKAHAVLFHARFMSNGSQVYELPKRPSTSQKWVFYEAEPPTNVWDRVNRSAPLWSAFNLTATYTSDSDVPVTYHKMFCKPRDKWKAPTTNYAQGKSKMVAWFVSHCKTSSKREIYAEELMKHVQVDVYGSCGNSTKCLRGSLDVQDEEDCMKTVISSEYKFYLSFENSFCSEYVTEKFNRMIRFVDVVPVVLGSADYGNVLPKGSYINAADFKSVSELAEHLKALDRDTEAYNAMINIKKAHYCKLTKGVEFKCALCEFLHNHRYEKQIVHDAADFWSPSLRCTSPDDVYRNIAPEILPHIKYETDPYVFQ